MRVNALFNDFGKIIELSSQEYLSVNTNRFKEIFNNHGVLLIRGTKVDRDLFEKFTGHFSSDFIVHSAKVRKRLSKDQTVQTVTEGYGPIVLHSEMAYSPFSPEVIWFYCETPAPVGGETTVGDGVQFYRKLSPRAQKLLMSQKLKYVNIWAPDRWLTHFPSESPDEVIQKMTQLGTQAHWINSETLYFEYLRSGITKSARGLAFANGISIHRQYEKEVNTFQESHDKQVRHGIFLENGDKIPEWLCNELTEIEEKVTQKVSWQNSDIVMIDNLTVLHGRCAFDPALQRSILLRMANWPKAA